MGHHHSRVYSILHDPERQRINQEFRRAGLEAAQYVDTQIASAGITLRGEERSYFIHQYIIAHTAEPSVAGQSKAMLAKIEADVAQKIAHEVGSCRNFANPFLQGLPPGNELRLQIEQELANLDAREKSLQLCKDENLKNYMELGKEGSAFIDQKIAAGDIRPLTSDEHTKLVNEYIELRAENPAVKTYAGTMEASIDAKIEYDAHEAERYLAYKKHHESHKHSNSFLYNVFKVVAIGCVAVFAPPLAASLGSFGAALATGAACATADAACQQAGIALGYQSKFSMNEVLETGVSCGVGSAASGLSTIPRAIAQAGSCTGTQIVELATDMRKEFDLSAVGFQAGASFASSAISSTMPVVNETVNETVPNLVDAFGKDNTSILASTLVNNVAISALDAIVTGNPISLENLSANVVGSFINSKVGASVDETSQPPAEENKLASKEDKIHHETNNQSNLEQSSSNPIQPNLDGMCLVENNPHVPVLPPELALKNFMTLIDVTLHQIQLAKKEMAKTEIRTAEIANESTEIEEPDDLPELELQKYEDDSPEAENARLKAEKEFLMQDLTEKLHAAIPDKSIFDQALPILEEAAATAAAVGAIAGALSLLPEGAATGMLTIISRVSAALFTCGPVSEVLIADELAAGTAGYLPATAIGAATIGTVSKALSKFSFFRMGIPTKQLVSKLEAESVADLSATNHINGLRLRQQLTIEQQKALFSPTGGLSQEAIKNSRLIIPGSDLGNPRLINELSKRPGNLSDWGKYATDPIHTPSGQVQLHFYHNPVTGEVYYDMDYKSIFEHQGTWKTKQISNFDYEPPQFR